jgi:VWFA-related protein
MPGRPSPLLRLAVPAVFAIPLLTQTALSQDNEAPATTLKINVRTVLVDVVVTDKDNKAIPGLGKDDFQVMEDGKPQQITFFEPNFAATPGEVNAAPSRNLPPNTFSNVPTFAPNNAVNLLLMDGLNTALVDQANVHKEMVRYLVPSLRVFASASFY